MKSVHEIKLCWRDMQQPRSRENHSVVQELDLLRVCAEKMYDHFFFLFSCSSTHSTTVGCSAPCCTVLCPHTHTLYFIIGTSVCASLHDELRVLKNHHHQFSLLSRKLIGMSTYKLGFLMKLRSGISDKFWRGLFKFEHNVRIKKKQTNKKLTKGGEPQEIQLRMQKNTI